MSHRMSHRLSRVAAYATVAVVAAAGGIAVGDHATPTTPSATAGQAPQGIGSSGGSGSSGSSGSSGNYGTFGGGYGGAPGSAAGSTPVQPAGLATTVETTGVVNILTTLNYGQEQAAGTGIVLTSSGRVLTNNHVIDGATSIVAVDLASGRDYRATVVGDSPTNDVAVLQLTGASGLQTAPLGDSADVRIGDTVTAVGNAGDAPDTAAAPGVVTALGQAITASDLGGSGAERISGLIETSADVQPGDSGGPLLNASDRVVGLDTAAATSRRGLTTAGYAIPIDQAIQLANSIVSGTSDATIQQGLPAFLGVELLLDGMAGAGSATTVQGVVPGSAAAAAGINPGDTITSVGGSAVASQSDVESAISAHRPGDRVSVTWLDVTGVTHQATITLGTGPAD